MPKKRWIWVWFCCVCNSEGHAISSEVCTSCEHGRCIDCHVRKQTIYTSRTTLEGQASLHCYLAGLEEEQAHDGELEEGDEKSGWLYGGFNLHDPCVVMIDL